MLCPVPSAQGLHAYNQTAVQQSRKKTLYNVTFGRRLWRCKQVIVCEQTRLCFCVRWLFCQGLSRLDSLAFSVHQKSACLRHSEQYPGWRRI